MCDCSCTPSTLILKETTPASALEMQDEGVVITPSIPFTAMNFIGAGVTASENPAGVVEVNIPAGVPPADNLWAELPINDDTWITSLNNISAHTLTPGANSRIQYVQIGKAIHCRIFLDITLTITNFTSWGFRLNLVPLLGASGANILDTTQLNTAGDYYAVTSHLTQALAIGSFLDTNIIQCLLAAAFPTHPTYTFRTVGGVGTNISTERVIISTEITLKGL